PHGSPHAPETARFGLHGAIVAGADALRLPVRLSSDGYAVVLEDETTDRLTGTAGSVASLTLKELRALDFGATFKSSDGKPFQYRARVETLPMLWDALPAGVWYFVDVKPEADTKRKKALAQQIAKAAVNRGIDARVVVYSNDPVVRGEVRKISGSIILAADVESGGGASALQNVDALVVPLEAFLADPKVGARVRLGAIVVSPETRFSAEQYDRLRKLATVWGITTNSILESTQLTRPGWVWVDEKWAQSAAKHEDVNANTWRLGYAKYNPEKFCHVYPDKGLHIEIKPYNKPVATPATGDAVQDKLSALTEDSWAALRTWPFYSGGGAGFAPGVRGDFSAEVDIESASAQQATTVELAAVNVDPATHIAPWKEVDGKWQPNVPSSFRDKHTFYDPHGAPPFVGVEHDEDDGWRINWNLGTDYDSNQYGKASGDGKQLKGRMRLDRRGSDWAAFYRPAGLTALADWICVGACRNESLNEVVYLRLAGKRWRQEDAAKPDQFVPVIPNHFVFRNFNLTRFKERES
ncbi:MAG TPA: glycerophosphodiester phosphodiesterase family protein, partial [Thermoanaerobaculia bacterium]